MTRAKYAPISAGPWLNKIGVARPTRVQVEPGVSIRIDPTDFVLRQILLTGAWEPGTWKAIDSHLPEGGTFIDVGAHVGYHSLKAAKKVGPDGRVIAIEPNPEAIRQLRENIEASDAGQIVVEEIACSDRDGVLELFSGDHSNLGTASLSLENMRVHGVRAPDNHEVQARPLDSVVKELQLSRVDVIKADVEGAELMVLKGAGRTLTQYRPVLIVETRDDLLRNLGSSKSELIEFLQNLGYREGRTAGGNYEWLPGEQSTKAAEAVRVPE